MNKVIFETKCWENDWLVLLKTNYIKNTLIKLDFPFSEKIVFINNVKDYDKVVYSAKALINAGVLSKYVIVKDYADEALDFFKLTREDFAGGYYYSIAELVSIYLADSDYILHFSGDAFPEKHLGMSWIKEAIELMHHNSHYKVAGLCWNKDIEDVKRESEEKMVGNFYVNQGFSDQNYLVKVKDFSDDIYRENSFDTSHYPAYGGELFEKRVNNWMRINNFKRLTYSKASYIHRNIAISGWRKKWLEMKR